MIDDSKPAAETRAELDRLRMDTRTLRRNLVKTMANPTAHFALTVPMLPPRNALPEPRDRAHRRLEALVAELRHIEHAFAQRETGLSQLWAALARLSRL